MHRIGITSFAYLPLKSATSEAPALIQKAVESVDELKESGTLELIENLKGDTLRDFEIIAFPDGEELRNCPQCTQHPLSLGTIHATSNDPLADPAIDPAYFENDNVADLENLVQHIKYISFYERDRTVEVWRHPRN
ncbi:hypothetical protein B0H13DRAFT_1856043 [Mycena leptocephala]|nr:hypothetical protein B0H13DRAFT_1856043 [Mycena leptocephala]